MEVKYRDKKASFLVLLVQNSNPKLICFVKPGLSKKNQNHALKQHSKPAEMNRFLCRAGNPQLGKQT